MKMTVFWVVAPCSLVEVYRRFKGACCPIIKAITLIMEAVSTSETSARRNNPEDNYPNPIVSSKFLSVRLLYASHLLSLFLHLSFEVFLSHSHETEKNTCNWLSA
jgi:hypothetical protein